MQSVAPEDVVAEGVVAPDEVSSALPAVVRIPLRPPRFFSPGFTVGLVSLLAIGSGAYAVFVVTPETLARPWVAAGMWLVPAGLGALLLAWRLATRPRAVPPLAFFDSHMVVPKSPGSRRALRVEYDTILSVDLRGRGAAERLCIGTERLLLTYPRLSFERPEAIDHAIKELYLRILRLPQGAAIAERIAQRRRLAIATLMNPAAATHGLLGAFVAVFALTFFMGALSRPLGIVRFGALAPELVRQGEVFRLLSATFLHQNVLHLYVNSLSLFFLGGLVERLLGWSRFLIIYFSAALGGALVVLVWPQGVATLGAMSGTAGLFGALVTVQWLFRRQLPASFRQPLNVWVFALAMLILVPLLTPGVNALSHLVGFGLGALMALLTTEPERSLDPTSSARPSLRAIGLVLALIHGVALLYAFTYAEGAGRFATLSLLRGMGEGGAAVSPERGNEAAWSVAIDPWASGDELRAARVVAQQALKAAPQSHAIIDTAAGVDYRLGAFREAIEAQLPLVDQGLAATYGLHFAQFLRAHYDKHGVWRVGDADAKGYVVHEQPGALALELPARAPAGVVYLVTKKGEGLAQLTRVRLGEGAQGRVALPNPEVKGDTVLMGLVRGCDDCSKGTSVVDAWRLDNIYPDLP